MNDDNESQLSKAQKEQKAQAAGHSDAADGGDGAPKTIPSLADLVGSKGATFLGLYFIAFGIALIYLLGVVWPPDFEIATIKAGLQPADRPKDVPSPIVFYKKTVSLPVAAIGQAEKTGTGELTPTPTAGSPAGKPRSRSRNDSGQKMAVVTTIYQLDTSYDLRLVLLVIVAGALGAYIHIVSSFADFVGNRLLIRSWIWWYILRPFAGVPLALVFYFVVRGGFLSTGASAGDINRFGTAAVAALVGMFSAKAAIKLGELFESLFRTKDYDKRKDSLTKAKNPAPAITAITTDGSKLKIAGSGFTQDSVVLVNGERRPVAEMTFVNGGELALALRPNDRGAAKLEIQVSNPEPGGGISEKKVATT
jgi:hypothetical protein